MAWADPEVVHDRELGRKLGIPEGHVVARSTEYGTRFTVTSQAELDQVLAFLNDSGQRGGGRHPVRRAWEIQDVRISAGDGAELPDKDAYRKAYLNTRKLPSGELLGTLSKEKLEGWDAKPVSLNADLWGLI